MNKIIITLENLIRKRIYFCPHCPEGSRAVISSIYPNNNIRKFTIVFTCGHHVLYEIELQDELKLAVFQLD